MADSAAEEAFTTQTTTSFDETALFEQFSASTIMEAMGDGVSEEARAKIMAGENPAEQARLLREYVASGSEDLLKIPGLAEKAEQDAKAAGSFSYGLTSSDGVPTTTVWRKLSAGDLDKFYSLKRADDADRSHIGEHKCTGVLLKREKQLGKR